LTSSNGKFSPWKVVEKNQHVMEYYGIYMGFITIYEFGSSAT
jgi:hypothetical protein